MQLVSRLSNKIIERALESCTKDINCSALARLIKIPRTSLLLKIAGKRRWCAESWIKTLWGLGLCEYEDGRICIKVAMLDSEIAELKNSHSKEVFEFRNKSFDQSASNGQSSSV